jgi:glycosyltransferase involved in cell wall biosynthesis
LSKGSDIRPTGAGAWISRFKLDEFTQLNRSWLGGAPDRAEALRRFHAEGVARLAPIAADARFEPDYYREVHPEYADHDDETAYRRWLFVDLEQNWPGSAAEHLERFGLTLEGYPAGFDWQAYARTAGLIENRWFALEHLIAAGAPPGGVPLTDQDGPAFAVAAGLVWRGRDDRSAVQAFRQARDLGDRSYLVTHQLADALFRLNAWSDALGLFEEAARAPDPDEVWTFVNGARAALRLGAFKRAAALLRLGCERHADHPERREAVRELVEARFATRTRRARLLYKTGAGRPRADRLVDEAARHAGALWSELDPVPASASARDPNGPVLILANYDIPACVHYRVEQKAELLTHLGRPHSIFRAEQWAEFIGALPGASAAIVFRMPAWPTVSRALDVARRLGIPTWYDVDDLVFDAAEFPDALESYGALLPRSDYESILFGVPLFRRALQSCDFGLASTAPLARAMEPLVRSRRVFVLPNGLDSRNEPFLALPLRPSSGGSVNIVYASGTQAHNADWQELAAPAILTVLETHPEARLTIIGHLNPGPAFDRFGDRVSHAPLVPDIGRFWDALAAADISLAVLKRSWATDAKSEIKWLEAAVLGIPSVVSATETYREVVEDGRDGLLAETPSDWAAALTRLVQDAALRAEMGAAARPKAVRLYSPGETALKLDAALRAGEAALAALT